MNRRKEAKRLARIQRQQRRAEKREARQAAPQRSESRGYNRQQERRRYTAQSQPTAPQKTQEYVSPYRNQQPENMSNSQYGESIRRLQEFNRGGTGFGAAALQRARASGVSDSDIRKGLFYGGYNVGQEAYDQLFSKNERIANTTGRPIRTHSGKISSVSGQGTENWTADTLQHMEERRAVYESTGRDLDRAEAITQERGWQPSSSFADLGDLRWYERTPDEQERQKAWDVNKYYRRLQQQ